MTQALSRGRPVAASTVNLGPGFDSIGLALGLFDVVTARVVPEGLHITVDGEGAGVVPDVEPSLTASSGELVARVRSLLTVDILQY